MNVRTAAAIAGISGATLVIGSTVTALSLLSFGRSKGTKWLPQAWAKAVLASSGVKLTVVGLDRFDHRAHYVMASNHVSLMDPPAIMAAAPQMVRFVAKSELFKIPVFGQAARAAGNIPVERGRVGSSTRKLAKVGTELHAQHLSLLFFPEGTRSEDGQLQAFKKGAAVLAIQNQVPILPIAVAGTREILPKGKVEIRPGRIGLAFGTPIDVAGRTAADRDAVTAQLRAAIEALIPEAEAARHA